MRNRAFDWRRWARLVPVFACGACFSPNQPAATSDDDASSDTGRGSTSGMVDGSGPPTGGPGTTDANGSSGSSSDSEDATTAPATSETGGPGCREPADCSDGEICLGGSCGPCSRAAAPDDECAAAYPDFAYCDETLGCVACVPATCEGATPTCDPSVGCQPCTEHSQCPDSACHLMGPDVGSCFDPADVAHVATVEQFEAALASVGPGAQQVIVVDDDLLGLGSYFIDGEVAIVASGPATLTGGFTNLFFVQPDAFLYLASLRIASGSFRMVSADGGLWVDDVVVSDYTIAARVTAEAHFRRSTLAASGLDSVVILSSGDLHIENSALGPGSDLGLSLTDGAVDVRYATIAGNASGVGCDASVEGESRNSIVASTGASSISGCEGLVWADDAVDAEGYGSQVGPYDDAWFTDPSQGDFHVTAAGQAALAGIADWDDGDPVADIDGDARPQREPGVPGIDEP